MSKSAVAIIGAGFGDEGKGLLTDAYAAKNTKDSIIIRYNGGAQAGHTVTTMDGKRHVFSHLGSGSFVGVPTFLSSFFVCNPLIFKKEYQKFVKRHSINPCTIIDPDSLVTTPFHMIVNQVKERRRGEDRHGSVGMGFGETVEQGELGLTYSDLWESESSLEQALLDIRDNYVPSRFSSNEPQINKAQDGNLYDALNNPQIIKDFIEMCKFMVDKTDMLSLDGIGDQFDDLIFEGAQGLQLSEELYDPIDCPYVTRSYTGVQNVLSIIDDIGGVNDLLINYVHRAYQTRHGAGLLVGEGPISFNVEDKTNKPNEFQGSLRFAPLDIDHLTDTIANDLSNINSNTHPYKQELTITCMDQIDNIVSFIVDDDDGLLPEAEFIDFMGSIADTLSFGPTRETIKQSRITDNSMPF